MGGALTPQRWHSPNRASFPTLVYCGNEEAHRNFYLAAWRNIQRHPVWLAHLDKVYAASYNLRFAVMLDSRSHDLIEDGFTVLRAVRWSTLRNRLQCFIWHEMVPQGRREDVLY